MIGGNMVHLTPRAALDRLPATIPPPIRLKPFLAVRCAGNRHSHREHMAGANLAVLASPIRIPFPPIRALFIRDPSPADPRLVHPPIRAPWRRQSAFRFRRSAPKTPCKNADKLCENTFG